MLIVVFFPLLCNILCIDELILGLINSFKKFNLIVRICITYCFIVVN